MAEPIVPTLAEVRNSRVGLNTCVVCGNDIYIMCRKFTGICSENCEKAKNCPDELPTAPIETEGHHSSE